mgnify:CR=1 FL=1
MDATIQSGGWFVVIIYLFIKDAIIPIIRKSIPAKVKGDIRTEQEQQKHEFAMEEKRLNADIEMRRSLTENLAKLAETQSQTTEILRGQNQRLQNIEADTKEIKEHVKAKRKVAR